MILQLITTYSPFIISLIIEENIIENYRQEPIYNLYTEADNYFSELEIFTQVFPK
ncbi:MAG: hypothetical protein ACRYE9_01020 [Janthinobacterium lividum]